MKAFIGVFRYEYRMSIRRWSLWLVSGLLMILYWTDLLVPPDSVGVIPNAHNMLSYAGTFAFMVNPFMPLVAGILVADRLIRDQKIGVDELLHSTPLKRGEYLAGKYIGALFSVVTPALLNCLIKGGMLALSGAPLGIIPTMLLAFVGINLPAYTLVTAFSLACPLVMPVRVYQVLFTGYWFWGNYLSPTVMPTLSDTFLSASGKFMQNAFMGGFFGGGGPITAHTPSSVEALINVAALVGCALLALVTADRIMAWRAQRA